MIDESVYGGVTVVHLRLKRLDANASTRFRAELGKIVDRGSRHIVLDMREVGFMDSSGLGAIVGVMKHLGRGGVLDIASPTRAVEKVFKLTHMDSVFKIFADVESALSNDQRSQSYG